MSEQVLLVVETEQLVVESSGAAQVLELETTVGAEMLEVALQGPPGAGAGAARHQHLQTTPAAVWTVPHNLNARPAVTVVDHLGRQIYPDVAWLDDDMVQVTHGSALTGAVYCS